jgi:hypothetical protein
MVKPLEFQKDCNTPLPVGTTGTTTELLFEEKAGDSG